MNDGRILFAELNGIYFIQPLGNVRYTLSRGLDKLISRIQGDSSAKEVVIDLSGTKYLDSTNLGLLAKVAAVSLTKFHKHPVLVSQNKNINTILDTMGFQKVFHMISGWITPNMQLQDTNDRNTPPDSRVLLEAHRQLCEMNDKNADTFHDVVELLATDMPA